MDEKCKCEEEHKKRRKKKKDKTRKMSNGKEWIKE